MSTSRVFVAECPLCRTKFETNPGSCPVCGGAELRAIHERMEAPTPIPVPTRKTQFVVERGEECGWVVLPPPEPPRNPTWRNGAPLTEPMALAPGDTISIGPVKAACAVSFR